MSNPSLVAFVTKLQNELSSYDEYRKELNRQPQTFVFHKKTLLTETLRQLEKGSKIKLSKDQKSHLKLLVDKAGDKLHRELEKIQGKTLKRPGGKTTVRFTNETDVPIPVHYDKFLPYTAFTRVKFAYRRTMNEFFQDMQDFLRNQTDHDVVRTRTGKEKKSIMHFFDAGHDKEAGVFEKFLDAKTIKIMSEIDKATERMSAQDLKTLQADLKSQGIDISLQKIDKSDSIIIKIESASENRSRGAKSGLRSKKLRAQVKAFLEKEDLEDLKGSDSIKERKDKKVRRVTTDPFKKTKNKNIKVLSKTSTKEKSSSTKKAKKKVKPKVVGKATTLNTVVRTRKTRKNRQPRSTTTDLLRMIGLINKKLPETVRKNMQEPALVNRSGKFASSVQVTEINQTAKGYPSIGYTYQKNPYQVFENGSAGNWSNGKRDPRDLIDKSIREVAAEMAIGRFYTRRV
jgi:hypothetical protein